MNTTNLWWWWAGSAGYLVAAFATLAAAAYRRGRRHGLAGHTSKFADCTFSMCFSICRSCDYVFVGIFWWAYWLIELLLLFVEKLEQGGRNSALPPKGSVEDGKL